MKKILYSFICIFTILSFVGCSSTNLNYIENKEEALYIKGGLSVDNKPLSLAIGYGKSDTKVFPMARGQGFHDVTVLADSSGDVKYACEFTLYPIGQDAILKVEKGNPPLFEIFGIKIGEDSNSFNYVVSSEENIKK